MTQPEPPPDESEREATVFPEITRGEEAGYAAADAANKES